MTDNIYSAINAVMKEVGYVQKERKSGLNYSFAGEAALIAALRPEMVEQGIVMNVSEIRNVVMEKYLTSNDKPMNSCTLDMCVRFTHIASNTFIDVWARGEGADAGDKSNNKAMTAAFKYALRQTFMIETGDDPDQFSSEGQERKGKKEEKKEEVDHSQKAFAKWALDTYQVTGKELGEIFGGAGIKTFHSYKWDEYIKIVAATKKNGRPA